MTRPWRGEQPPERILAIRLQAMGDVAITLPYLAALRRVLPRARIDLLTRREVGGLPAATTIFNRVFQLGGGRSERRQLALLPSHMIALWARRYQVVVDLQNNRVSRVVRRLIAPAAWTEFDRFSPLGAGVRTRQTIEAIGLELPPGASDVRLADPASGRALSAAGWRVDDDLVVLSPAGAFPTRNWPLDSYIRFAEIWRARHPRARFVVMGLPSLAAKAAALRRTLGDDLIDLTGKTTTAEAFAILKGSTLVVSEDCGLMHMAWVSGAPTLALFGSSRHDWSAPVGEHTRCLHSGDLSCGACMSPVCQFGDTRCLTRYTPELVAAEAERLLSAISSARELRARDPQRSIT